MLIKRKLKKVYNSMFQTYSSESKFVKENECSNFYQS